MKKLLVVVLLAAGLSSCESESTTGTCTRICTTGKACGDTCIASNLNCNVGPGNACNGNIEAVDR